MSKIIRLLSIAVLTKCFVAQIGPNTQLENPEISKNEHPGHALQQCPEEKETDISNNPDSKKFAVCKTPASVVAAILKGMKEETFTAPKRGSSTPSYYTALSATELASDRYKPLCRVFFRRDVKVLGFYPRTKKGSCSCMFIGPSLVLTAAHCFTELGVKCKPEDKKPWVVEVVQQYGLGGEANHASHMKTHRRLVTRWWYSKYYLDKTISDGCNIEHDYEFMETNEPNVGGKFYKFEALNYNKQVGELHKNGDKTILESVGYPGNYLNSEVAVRVTGEYENPNAVRQFQVVQRTKGEQHNAGNGRGASGGPILFNEVSLKKLPSAERTEKEMWLLGINSQANDEEYPTYTRSPRFFDDYAFKAKDIKLPAEANAAAATNPLQAPENIESFISTA